MSGKRKAVSTRTRFEVFKRDEFRCQYCGRTPPEVVLHVDHVLPVVEGGTNDPINLLTACADCNLGKAGVPLGSVHRPVAEQIAEGRDRAEQLAAFNAFLAERRDAEAQAVERIGRDWFNRLADKPEDRDRFVFGSARIPTARTFVRRLPEVRILEAMDIAEARIFIHRDQSDWKRWKYFCGVCWRMIREAEEAR